MEHRPVKKVRQFRVDLAQDQPAIIESLAEITPALRLKTLEKKLNRYRRRYARVVQVAETLTADKAELQTAVAAAHAQVAALESENRRVQEQLANQRKEGNSNELSGLFELQIQNMQEKLFAQNDTIRELNLQVSKSQLTIEQLQKQLHEARVEVHSLQAQLTS